MSEKNSSEIHSIEPELRDHLSYHSFTGVTESGYHFTIQMLGTDHAHAYRRLNNQTGKQLNLPNLIG